MASPDQSTNPTFPVAPAWSGPGSTDYTAFYQTQDDYHQWWEDQKSMADDDAMANSAVQAMEQLMAEAKGGHNWNAEFMAMMLFFYQVMPSLMQSQQDNISALADSQNIDSDLRTFVTNIQSDINSGYSAQTGGYSISAATGSDIAGNLTDLSQMASFLSQVTVNGQSPLDASDANTLAANVTSIQTIIGASGSPQSCGGKIATNLAQIFNTSNITNSNWQTQSQQQLSSLQQNLQQANSTTSSIATTVQTTEQFYVNQYNQFTGIDNSLQQSYASTNTSMVNNQKSN